VGGGRVRLGGSDQTGADSSLEADTASRTIGANEAGLAPWRMSVVPVPGLASDARRSCLHVPARRAQSLSEALAGWRGSGNSRNATTGKTLLTDAGPVDLAVPRDRQGSFEPKIVPKGQTARPG
jgi:hypothetical protein